MQPLERVLGWARQLVSALSYLHSQTPPVIHRDIKPANVRLSADGDAMLVDFGIAKISDSNQQATTKGASGYTPGYAPPEQYGGAVRTGPYTDQYSLAALLFHLLTDQKPADSVERAVGSAQLESLRQLNPSVPEHVQTAIERALSLRSNERYRSVDEFFQALTTPAAVQNAYNAATVLAAKPPVESVPHTDALLAETRAAQKPEPGPTARPAQTGPTSQVEMAIPAEILAPRKRGPNGLLIGGIGLIAFLGIGAAAVLLGGWLLRQTGQNPTQVSPMVIIQASDTPSPQSMAPTFTLAASSTPPPPVSTTPAPPASTDTLEPIAAVASTDTPSPSPTPLLVGGGGLLAFASDRGDGQTLQIWTMRVSLNDQGQMGIEDLKQLTGSPGDKSQPAWSPDGKRLLYLAPGGPDQKLDIWMMNADGSGEPKDLTNKKGNETEPAWSPDGKWIAFTSDGRFDNVLQVYLIRPDGSETYRLSYDQQEFGPAWAPNNHLTFIMNSAGAQIVFTRGLTDPKTGAQPTREYYVTPFRFDKMSFTDNLGQAAEPAWSPDGVWLVYTRQRGSSNTISLSHNPIRVPEKDVIRLTDSGKDTNPCWAPDGQWIVFHSARDGNAEIYIMRSTGQSQTNLTKSPSRDMDPAWQPAVK